MCKNTPPKKAAGAGKNFTLFFCVILHFNFKCAAMIFTPASHRFSFSVKVGPSCAAVERAWGKESKCCGHKALKVCPWITPINHRHHRLTCGFDTSSEFFSFCCCCYRFFCIATCFYRPAWDFHGISRESKA